MKVNNLAKNTVVGTNCSGPIKNRKTQLANIIMWNVQVYAVASLAILGREYGLTLYLDRLGFNVVGIMYQLSKDYQ